MFSDVRGSTAMAEAMRPSAATGAGLDLDGVERRDLALKGKEAPTSVAVISAPHRPASRKRAG
jgi:hypothetical protein